MLYAVLKCKREFKAGCDPSHNRLQNIMTNHVAALHNENIYSLTWWKNKMGVGGEQKCYMSDWIYQCYREKMLQINYNICTCINVIVSDCLFCRTKPMKDLLLCGCAIQTVVQISNAKMWSVVQTLSMDVCGKGSSRGSYLQLRPPENEAQWINGANRIWLHQKITPYTLYCEPTTQYFT